MADESTLADSSELSSDAIRRELERILTSYQFAASERLRRFLRFIVEETLSGRERELKEYSIATQVYDRGESFDPRADAIVRTEAIRLRARLQQYYASGESPTMVRIDLPKGGYVPRFRHTAAAPVVPSESTRPPRPRPAWWPVAALAAALLTVLVVAVSVYTRNRSETPPFHQSDWLLIGTFDNRTGEALLSGTLETGLEMELSRSAFLNIVPRARVEDTLRLMRLPADSSLPPSVAREVALRDGAVPVVLTGAIAKIGTTYTLALRLIDAGRASALGTYGARGATPDAVLGELRGAASWIRHALGEGNVSPSRADSLEPATTASLQALRFFSQGMVAINSRQWPEAEALLTLAVAEDPQFASAYIYLMYAVRNQVKPEAAWRPYLERARELAPNVSERERLFVLGSVHGVEGDRRGAIAFYEALLRTYPNDYWSLNNLTILLVEEDPIRAPEYRARVADQRPNDVDSNLAAAWTIARRDGHLENAERFVTRVRQLTAGSELAFKLDVLSAFDAWMRGDVGSVRATFKRLLTLRRRRDPDYIASVVLPAIGMGFLASAEAMIPEWADPAIVHRWMPWVAAARGDRRAFQQQARGLSPTPPNALSTIVLIRAGRLDQARRMLAQGGDRQSRLDDRRAFGVWQVARGELELALGRKREARALLDQAMPLILDARLPSMSLSEIFVGAESLARLHVEDGELEEARRVLRNAVAQRVDAFGPALYFWVRCAARLVELERRLGSAQAAAELEQQLESLLADADAEFRLTADSRSSADGRQH